MENAFTRHFVTAFEKAPFGIAFHRARSAPDGKVHDFECVGMNEAFERLTGIDQQQSIGKSWKELFPDGECAFSRLVSESGLASLQEGEKEWETFCPHIKAWLRLRIVATGDGFLYSFVHDITQEIEVTRASALFLQDSLEDIGFQAILDKAREISGAPYAFFHLYDDKKKLSTTVAVSGEAQHVQQAESLLGRSFVGLQWPDEPQLSARYADKPGPRFFSVVETVGERIPSPLLHSLAQKFGVQNVAILLIQRFDKTLGNFTFFLPPDQPLKNLRQLEAFSQQVGHLMVRSRVEEQLRQSEERFQKVLNAVPDMVSVHDLGMNILFSNWNGFAAVPEDKRVPYTKCFETYRGLQHVCPDCQAKTVLETGKPFHSEVQLPDGTWVDLRVFPLFDEKGKCTSFVEWVRNITQRKNAEEALVQSEELYRRLSEDMPVYVCRFLPDGRVTYVNPLLARQVEKSQGLSQGSKLGTLIPPEGFQQIQEVLDSLSAENPIITHVQKITDRKGNERWNQWISRGFFDESGKLQFVQAVGQDITPLKNLERDLVAAKEEAESANQAKTRFLLNMSHELRTPLNGIMGFTRLLGNTEVTGEQKEFMHNILVSSNALKNVIGNILDFSKIEAGKMVLNLEETNLQNICRQTLQIVSFQARKKHLQLELDWEPQNPETAKLDGLRLQQVLLNLLANAVKFTLQGKVVLRVFLPEPQPRGNFAQLRFEVEDTGIGISEEVSKRIFHPFEQADSSTTRKFGGSGLGLSICQGLLELMHSSLQLRSTPGKGSVFSFELEFPVLPHGMHPSLPELKVLLSLEDPFQRYVLKKTLKSLFPHATFLGFASGKLLSDSFREKKPDVILLDVADDCFQAALQIREWEKANSGHVLLIGICSEEDTVAGKSCLASGMDHCLSLPVSSAELQEILKESFPPREE